MAGRFVAGRFVDRMLRFRTFLGLTSPGPDIFASINENLAAYTICA